MGTCLHQLPKIELGRFQNLNFPYEDILKGINASSLLLNLLSNYFRNKFCNQLLQITGCCLFCHDLYHLSSYLTTIRKENRYNSLIDQRKFL